MSFVTNEEGVRVTEIPKDFSDGRTKQSFKDATDINKIVARFQREGTVSHLAKYEGVYGDFSDIPDLLTAHNRMQRAQEIFDEAPSEIRKEFRGDVGQFFQFVNDPANKDDLARILPALAKPGRQNVPVRRTAANMNPADDSPTGEAIASPAAAPAASGGDTAPASSST